MSSMSDIELGPHEHIVKQAGARSKQPPIPIEVKSRPQFFADGRLYLTNKRLIWKRRWYTMPFIPVRSFEIALTDIRDCRLGGSGMKMLAAGGGLFIITETHKHALLIAKGQLWPPALWFSRRVAEEWHGAILNATRPRTS